MKLSALLEEIITWIFTCQISAKKYCIHWETSILQNLGLCNNNSHTAWLDLSSSSQVLHLLDFWPWLKSAPRRPPIPAVLWWRIKCGVSSNCQLWPLILPSTEALTVIHFMCGMWATASYILVFLYTYLLVTQIVSIPFSRPFSAGARKFSLTTTHKCGKTWT